MASLSIDLSNPILMSSGSTFERARSELGPEIWRLKSPEFYSSGLVLGYGYGPTSLDQAQTPAEYRPIVAAGNRLPHRFIKGRPIYDLLGPWFTAIGTAHAVAPLMSEAAKRGIPIFHLESEDPGVVLVRPDQHIAWVGAGALGWADLLSSALLGFSPDRCSAANVEENASIH